MNQFIKPIVLALVILLPFENGFSQTLSSKKDSKLLYQIFARSYLSGQIGFRRDKTIMVATNQANYNYYNPATTGLIVYLSYGHHLKNRFWLQFNAGSSHSTLSYNFSFFPNISEGSSEGNGTIFQYWDFSVLLSYYYPLLDKKIYVSGKAGPSMIRVDHLKSTASTLSYNGIMIDEFPHHYMPGVTGGLEIDFKIGKRLLLFGSYRFNQLVLDSYFVKEHTKYRAAPTPLLYYDTELKPFSQIFTIGAKFSLENSLFYKKK